VKNELNAQKAVNIRVIFSFLKANKSSLLLKILALMLVTIAIASSFFFLDSFQPQFSTNYMNNIKVDQNDIVLSFDFSYEDYLEEAGGTIDNFIFANALANNLSTQFRNFMGDDSLSEVYSQESTHAFSYHEVNNFTLALVNANNFGLEQLAKYSFEENSSVELFEGGILVLEQTFLKYSPTESSLLNESRVILGNGLTEVSQSNFTIDFYSKVIWDNQDFSLFSKITKIVGENDIALVVSDEVFKNYLMFINITSSMFDVSTNIFLDINYSEINFDNSVLLQDQIYQFVYSAQNFVLDEYSINANFSSELVFFSLLADLDKTILIIDSLVLVFTVPTILFSLLVLYFSNEYFSTKRTKLFSFYYSKGSSTQQLFYFVFSEFLISTISALISGFSLSIPLTLLMIKNPSFINIHNSSSLVDYSLNISYINILWISLIVLAIGLLILMKNTKLTLSQNTVKEDFEFEDGFDRKRVFWKNFYFDFLLLLVGVCILILEKTLFQDTHDFSTQFFIFFFGLLVIIIALVLVLLRFLPNVLSTISNYLWKIFGGFLSFATRLFNVRKRIIVRNIVTFALCISYMLVLVQVVYAIDQFSDEQAYFNVGADARIDFSDDSNITAITNALPSNIYYTEITKYNQQNFLTGERLVFFVIDPNTFLSAAYFKDDFLLEKTSTEVIGKITQNLTILSYQEVAESNSWAFGYNYTLTLSYGSTNRLSLKVVDYFNSWPFFIDSSQQADGIPFIIGKETSDVLRKNSTELSRHILINLPNTEDYAQIEKYLEEEVLTSNETLVIIDDGYEQFWNEPFWYILNTFSVINLYLIGLLFVILSFISLITLENNRKAEIGMFLALGIKRSQIFLLSLIEQMSVLITGLLLGISIGLPSSIFLNNQLKANFLIPIGNLGIFWIVGLIILGIIIFNFLLITSWGFRTSSRKVEFFIQELELHNESDD